MLRDHPVIERVERTGYITSKPIDFRFDTLGYPIKKGDPILKVDVNGEKKIFSEENLTINELVILSECGAIEDEA